jgi:fucose 4-O-acetylase-like acetyltransferase
MVEVVIKDIARSARIEWIDVAKGLGIVLVVLGHVLNGMSISGLAGNLKTLFEAIGHFIYTFHMPVFLVLAGVFAPSAVNKSSSVFWADKLGGFVYPYFLWSVLQIGIQIVLTGYTSTPVTWHDLYAIFYHPSMQFWFLYCLFLSIIIYRIIVNFGGGARLFYLLSLLLSFALNFYNFEGTSVLGRLRDNLPFFALGAVISPLILRISLLPAWLLSTVMIGGFWLTAVMLDMNLSPRFLVGLSLPLLGIASVFALAMLLVRWRITFGLTYLGQMSLEIYLAHVLAYAGTRIVLLRVLHITSMPIHLVSGLIVGLGLPVVLAIIAKRYKFPYLFRLPMRLLKLMDGK